ncbi:MAG: precorrin-2 dehydrogenase [Actinomycetota bacterium]|jgi:siroheme synthase-like protein|nr:precorrin-2 dehydrogenase [Actinomycetota bacterium]
MPFAFPISLDLAGHRCVVIGTLPVREGKVDALLAGGATEVVVIATAPEGALADLEGKYAVRVLRREWEPADLDHATLSIGWAPSQDERDRLAREARSRGVLINVVDDIANCDWAMPSIVRRGELVLAISSGGASPALTKKLREHLQNEFGEEWAGVLVILREVREETMPLLPDFGIRAQRWSAALDLDEATALVRSGGAEELRRRLRERLLQDVTV